MGHELWPTKTLQNKYLKVKITLPFKTFPRTKMNCGYRNKPLKCLYFHVLSST